MLLQEVERWNGVVTSMAHSLKELERALAGEIGFSSSLEELSGVCAMSGYAMQLPQYPCLSL